MFALLLAEATSTTASTPWWVTVGSTVGASVATYLVNLWMQIKKDRRKETVEDRTVERQAKKEDVNQIIEDQREFIERQARVIEEDRKTYQTSLQEVKRNYQDSLKELNKEITNLRQEVKQTAARQVAAEKMALKYQLRVAHLEEVLEGRGIPFKRLKDDDSATLLSPPRPNPSPDEEAF